jgi:hypothetical protein
MDAAKKKALSPAGLAALRLMLLLVVTLFLPQTRVWGVEAPPQHASGKIAFASASATGEIALALAYDALDCRVAADTAGTLRFSQTTASPFFSEGGTFSGSSIADVANDLRTGALSPADVPVQYLARDGNSLIINTRSSLSLMQANIPVSQWSLIDQTGVEAAEASMTQRLLRNGLGSQGTDVLRVTGAGSGASLLQP